MATFDVFTADGFSALELTDALNLIDFKPQFLGSLNIFTPRPVRTITVAVESRNETLSLVQTSPRGAPNTQRKTSPRELRNFSTVRISLEDNIWADELQNIRAFGQETELESVAVEVARRQMLLRDDIDLTTENMRLGAVQGIVTDADGSVIIDWFSEFGIAQPAEIAFDLANTAAGALRQKFTDNVVRPIKRNGKGLVAGNDQIVGLCGDDFFDTLINHEEIRDVIKRSPRQEELLNDPSFGQFDFAGIRFVNYRGTDDGSTVAVADAEVKFFPASRRVFEVAWSPGETLSMVNTPGRPFVSHLVPDPEMPDDPRFMKLIVASYPLYICKRPQTLFRGKAGA